MATQIDWPVHRESDAEFRGAIQQMLARGTGEAPVIRAIERRPSEFATLFPAEVLNVVLDDGRRLWLFLKHLGTEGASHPDKERPDREVLVYQHLLRDPSLPVARYYGSWRNDLSGRFELLLEHLPSWNLKYHDWPAWHTTAARLGDIHAHFARRRDILLGADYLLRLDERYHTQWADRAVREIMDRLPELGRLLDGAVAKYPPLARLLAGQPLTLVHNDLGPKNVVVDTSVDPHRVCLIDWEMAGMGCALLDLVHLRYNRVDPANDQRMLELYRERVDGADLVPADESQFRRLLGACELHRTFYRLAHCHKWGWSEADVAERISFARNFIDRLC